MQKLPVTPQPDTAIAEIARCKTLCDILFGASDGEQYARVTGKELTGFSLCVIGLGDSGPGIAEAIQWAADLYQCRNACVFAVSPNRIALVWERAEGDGVQPKVGWLMTAARLRFGAEAAIAAEAVRGTGAAEMRQCYLECIGALSLRLPAEEPAPGGCDTAHSVSPALKKALEFIALHYTEPLTLNGVAERAFVSPCYVSRLFVKELGVSFVDYVTMMRLEKAKRLLRSTDLKVIEIAEMAGIVDAHYFTRLFKKNTGVSPTEYRFIPVV